MKHGSMNKPRVYNAVCSTTRSQRVLTAVTAMLSDMWFHSQNSTALVKPTDFW